jgi:phosphoenolpyruvate carboxykinase (ATP)
MRRNLKSTRQSSIEDFIFRFGTVLENVGFYGKSRDVNYFDTELTENTRASYPLEYIDSAKIPAIGSQPKNIIFLTCDAYGVLPPVSKLT